MRFRKHDNAHNLLAAVQHYVMGKGGDLVVIGGIEIQRWPGDAVGLFRVAVRCLGNAPQKKEQPK